MIESSTQQPLGLGLTRPVEVVILDRPHRGNALNAELSAGLMERVPLEPPPGRRCYLLYGAGSVFCSGADLGEVVGETAAGVRDDFPRREQEATEIMDRLVRQPLPVIAWLNGPAIGAGAILAMLADLRIVASSAYLSIPAAKLGLCFGPQHVDIVTKAVGRPIATELLLTGRKVDAHTLLEQHIAIMGVETLGEAARFAEQIAKLAPLSLRGHRRALQGEVEESTALAVKARLSDDLREGVAAYLERRSAQFTGT